MLKKLRQDIAIIKRCHVTILNISKTLYALKLALVPIRALLPIIISYYTALILDQLIKSLTSKSVIDSELFNLIVFITILRISSTLMYRIRRFIDVRLEKTVKDCLEIQMFNKVNSLDVSFYENQDNLDIYNAARGRLFNIYIHYEKTVDTLVDLISIVSYFGLIYFLSIKLFILFILISVPAIIAVKYTKTLNWQLYKFKRENNRELGGLSHYLDSRQYLKEIKLHGIKDYLINIYTSKLNISRKEELKTDDKINITTLLDNTLHHLGIAYMTYEIIKMVFNKTITLGQFTFYTSRLSALSTDVDALIRALVDIQEQRPYMEEVFKFFDYKNSINNGDKILNNKNTFSIEFKNVGFKYPETKKFILKDFNLKIAPGEHIAIVGENGAGKTTLIKLLLRFYDVTEGEILINNINIKELNLDNYYQQISGLFQDYNFYYFNAKENIGIGDIKKMHNFKAIKEAAKLTEAHDFIMEYPKKYKQILSRNLKGGIEPSKGQQQKIALARSFFRQAPLLILDEPTSAIDPKAEHKIFKQLFDMAKNKTVITISHRFSTVRNANRIIVLDKGQIIEDGTHQDLMQIENGIYKHAFELQKQGYN